MMSDRDLLALAAKAAGYEVGLYHTTISDGSATKEILYCRDGKAVRTAWNPLTDDGDALRLAVKLSLCIDTHCGLNTYAWLGDSEGIEEHANDPYAASRRAIVRAAAEIGKAMP